jgi:anti-sigma B factor antagonist
MELKEKIFGDVKVLYLDGSLKGGSEVTKLHGAIKGCLDEKTDKIVIDLKDVHWMGSVGIGILICCLTAVKNAGGDMKLSGLNEKIHDLLRMTKLEKIFEIYPDAESATSSFNEK